MGLAAVLSADSKRWANFCLTMLMETDFTKMLMETEVA